MKLSRPVAVAAAVVLLAGGMVAADAVTTTNPVKLCANSKTGAVEVPKNGACAKGTTTFFVASQADVAALAQRADAFEAENSTQADQIAALQATVEKLTPGELVASTESDTPGIYTLIVQGSELEPGTSVYQVYEDTSRARFFLGRAADGTFGLRVGGFTCDWGPFHIEATREGDWGPIRTPVLTGAGC